MYGVTSGVWVVFRLEISLFRANTHVVAKIPVAAVTSDLGAELFVSFRPKSSRRGTTPSDHIDVCVCEQFWGFDDIASVESELGQGFLVYGI